MNVPLRRARSCLGLEGLSLAHRRAVGSRLLVRVGRELDPERWFVHEGRAIWPSAISLPSVSAAVGVNRAPRPRARHQGTSPS